MEKRIKFSDQPLKVKIVYGAVVAVLLITAIVVGIVSVASRSNGTPDAGDNPPPVTDGPTGDVGDGGNDGGAGGDATPDEPTLFSAPVVGSIMKSHSTDTPVFSDTLNEWRIHTGIDIAAEEGDSVCAAGDGVVSKVYNDHFLGKTVEITHAGGLITVYSNLSGDGVTVAEGAKVKCGDKIGVVGDTSLHELADEAHLHFEVRLDGKAVNPLEHISEESKKTAFGIADT
jgi:murein DD-endopeptidase MepM/ murein hydrolase activator NlpD